MPEPTLIHQPSAELLVDVVIPVLNEAQVLAENVTIRGEFIDKAVTWRWRIVMVDNGSTDRTDDVGRQLSREYPEVQSVQLPQRGRGRKVLPPDQGSPGSRNRGRREPGQDHQNPLGRHPFPTSTRNPARHAWPHSS